MVANPNVPGRGSLVDIISDAEVPARGADVIRGYFPAFDTAWEKRDMMQLVQLFMNTKEKFVAWWQQLDFSAQIAVKNELIAFVREQTSEENLKRQSPRISTLIWAGLLAALPTPSVEVSTPKPLLESAMAAVTDPVAAAVAGMVTPLVDAANQAVQEPAAEVATAPAAEPMRAMNPPAASVDNSAWERPVPSSAAAPVAAVLYVNPTPATGLTYDPIPVFLTPEVKGAAGPMGDHYTDILTPPAGEGTPVVVVEAKPTLPKWDAIAAAFNDLAPGVGSTALTLSLADEPRAQALLATVGDLDDLQRAFLTDQLILTNVVQGGGLEPVQLVAAWLVAEKSERFPPSYQLPSLGQWQAATDSRVLSALIPLINERLHSVDQILPGDDGDSIKEALALALVHPTNPLVLSDNLLSPLTPASLPDSLRGVESKFLEGANALGQTVVITAADVERLEALNTELRALDAPVAELMQAQLAALGLGTEVDGAPGNQTVGHFLLAEKQELLPATYQIVAADTLARLKTALWPAFAPVLSQYLPRGEVYFDSELPFSEAALTTLATATVLSENPLQINAALLSQLETDLAELEASRLVLAEASPEVQEAAQAYMQVCGQAATTADVIALENLIACGDAPETLPLQMMILEVAGSSFRMEYTAENAAMTLAAIKDGTLDPALLLAATNAYEALVAPDMIAWLHQYNNQPADTDLDYLFERYQLVDLAGLLEDLQAFKTAQETPEVTVSAALLSEPPAAEVAPTAPNADEVAQQQSPVAPLVPPEIDPLPEVDVSVVASAAPEAPTVALSAPEPIEGPSPIAAVMAPAEAEVPAEAAAVPAGPVLSDVAPVMPGAPVITSTEPLTEVKIAQLEAALQAIPQPLSAPGFESLANVQATADSIAERPVQPEVEVAAVVEEPAPVLEAVQTVETVDIIGHLEGLDNFAAYEVNSDGTLNLERGALRNLVDANGGLNGNVNLEDGSSVIIRFDKGDTIYFVGFDIQKRADGLVDYVNQEIVEQIEKEAR